MQNFEINQLKAIILNYKLSGGAGGTGFQFPEGSFSALVKGLMHKDVILLVNGKEVLVRNEAGLVPGEMLKLMARKKVDGFELQILNREFSNVKNDANSFILREEFLDNFILRSLKNGVEDENKIYNLLKSFIPALDWKENTKYFNWETQDGSGNGYFGEKENEKKFFLEIKSHILGDIKILLSWSTEEMDDLKIQFWFKETKSYLLSLKLQNELEQMLAEDSINPISLSYHLKNTEIRGEWQA